MIDLVVGSPGWLVAALSIVLSCLCSVGLVAVVRRVIPQEPGEHHNEVLGMLLSVGGIFCAIVVALVVFVVWDHLTTAHQAEVDEGSSLMVLYRQAQGLPPPARAAVESAVRDYTTSLIDDEFPLLARGESSDETELRLTRVNLVTRQYLSNTTAPDLVNTVAQSQYQLVLAGRDAMPPALWALLLGTCVLLFLMTAPLFMENLRYQALGSVLLGCAVGASLYLVLMADHPFSGPLQVRPTDLVDNLHTYSVVDGDTAR